MKKGAEVLIERNLAPALLLFGGALVLPGVAMALRHAPTEPSAGAMVTGNLLAGLGLFLSALLAADLDATLVRRIVLGFFAIVGLAFAVGTGLAALPPAGGIRWVLGLSGLLPPLGAAGGIAGSWRR